MIGRRGWIAWLLVVPALTFAPLQAGAQGSAGGTDGGANDGDGVGGGAYGGGADGGATNSGPTSGGATSGGGAGAGPAAPGPGHDAGDVERVLLAQVRFAADGVVVVDGGSLHDGSAWSPYLATGMWLRAQGRWQGERFEARALEVARPALFSYLLAPREPEGGAWGGVWFETWFEADASGQPGTLLARRPHPEAAELSFLGRWLDGGWQALPPEVDPPPPPGDGWWLLRGTLDAAPGARSAPPRWGEPTPFPPP